MTKTIHDEVVLLVAIIAIARKVVILEPKEVDGTNLLGIVALSAGYYFVRVRGRKAETPHGKPAGSRILQGRLLGGGGRDCSFAAAE